MWWFLWHVRDRDDVRHGRHLPSQPAERHPLLVRQGRHRGPIRLSGRQVGSAGASDDAGGQVPGMRNQFNGIGRLRDHLPALHAVPVRGAAAALQLLLHLPSYATSSEFGTALHLGPGFAPPLVRSSCRHRNRVLNLLGTVLKGFGSPSELPVHVFADGSRLEPRSVRPRGVLTWVSGLPVFAPVLDPPILTARIWWLLAVPRAHGARGRGEGAGGLVGLLRFRRSRIRTPRSTP